MDLFGGFYQKMTAAAARLQTGLKMPVYCTTLALVDLLRGANQKKNQA